MDLLIGHYQISNSDKVGEISITGSKSESNRLLILKNQFPDLQIKNLSKSDDTTYLKKMLSSKEYILDIGHAGTAMRFGTAYFACQENREVVLTGSSRMKQRPIKILVDALNELGGEVSFMEQEGYPPLKIKGKKMKGGAINIDGGVSSQFLTALLLVATKFDEGLNLHITNLTSIPYLKMTFNILKDLGFKVSWEEQGSYTIISLEGNSEIGKNQIFEVESDWSSAGYWFSWVSMQEQGYKMELGHFKKNSLQGDSKLREVYKILGVSSQVNEGKLALIKEPVSLPEVFEYDFSDIPDQAQTVFATCIGLGIGIKFTGLHTLKVKETDRIEAMKIVGSRFRESEISTTTDTISMKMLAQSTFKNKVIVDTFQDHRMAMAFAPLCTKTSMIIKDAGVVTKSYHDFWDDLKRLGVDISER
ncbi:MAG: 3-phosphoshikimate 1-carboxyvinyltransferase [Nonlabens sp.]